MSEMTASGDPASTEWSEIDALRREILRLRDELIGAQAQMGEMQARLRVATERQRFDNEIREVSDLENVLAVNADLEQQLDDIRHSTSWRLGRAIVRPLSLLRRRADSELPGVGSAV